MSISFHLPTKSMILHVISIGTTLGAAILSCLTTPDPTTGVVAGASAATAISGFLVAINAKKAAAVVAAAAPLATVVAPLVTELRSVKTASDAVTAAETILPVIGAMVKK